MKYTINAAIQVLPSGNKKFAYSIIDKVIDHIAASGITYRVCPFETVLEGEYERIVGLLGEIKELCFREGAEDLLINMKWQFGHKKNIAISDKMNKYEN